jgi:molecular chaperone GrpE
MDNSSEEEAVNNSQAEAVADQDENQTEEKEAVEVEEESLSDLEKKELELKAMNDKYLRLYSEFDNFRRRTQKEKLELYKTAGEDIFKSLLSVMDDFDRAKRSMEETQDYDSLKIGVDLIYNKLLGVFKANGAEPMKSTIGEKFDSEIHEAITQIPAPSKKMKGKVVDEIEKGYTLKDKVIRFAKVVVGQ